MSTTNARVPLAQARLIAEALVASLAPVCERIEIAGSVRRQCSTVGDIEIVAVPNVAPPVWQQTDLFGTATARSAEAEEDNGDALDTLLRDLLARGVVAHRLDKHGRPAFGRRYKRLTYGPGGGIGLDVFAVKPPAQWGVLLAIRTGSAGFARRLVTSRVMGGWLPVGCQVKDGAVWDGRSGQVVPMPQEADLFRFCEVPYLPPEQRTDSVQLARRGACQWLMPQETR